MATLHGRAASRRRPALPARLAAALVTLALVAPAAATAASAPTGTYRNPILPDIPGDGVVESCADPVVTRGREGEMDPSTGELLWFVYCTTDPLNDEDRVESDEFHFIPMFSSTDLVNWTYRGDAFAERPDWVGNVDFLWAPEIAYLNGQYYLYFAASWTDAGGSAVGVATSDSPLGPWTDSGDPVVDPLPDFRWAFDPEIVTVDGSPWILFGSYFGGIKARQLTPDGLESLPATQRDITIDNRYEGAEVVLHDGWYYLFASASNCCNGPLTGYGVFVGRSRSPLGPYVDREGVSLLDLDVGGTPVIAQNGNRWVGTGHNTVFEDFDGQTWTMYHAVDVTDPYFEGAPGFTKRPTMLDAIDWIDGWPTLNGGAGPSDRPQQAPAAQPGETTNHRVQVVAADALGTRIGAASDEFDDGVVGAQWSGVRGPAASEANGVLTLPVQQADLFEGSNSASLLVEDAPDGNWVVETKVRLNVPDDCCRNYAQAGLVLYGDDDNFIKLVKFANWNTRQTEFAKEVFPVPAPGYARYGNMVVGPVGHEWTWLRIVKRSTTNGSVEGPYGGDERYTAYTSHDGLTWTRGGTWAHHLGDDLRIGIVAMGLTFPPPDPPWTADFDYVRVSRVHR